MSNICRYFDECMLREFEENPYLCDSRGNVRYEMWDCGKPTGMQYDGTCEMYQPMPDVDALLALAEDVDEAATMAVVMDDSKGTKLLADLLLDIARRIREACGEVES